MVLKPLSEYGWKVKDSLLTFDWDSEDNMAAVPQQVECLTKGCKCKTGCRTLRCGCRKRGKECSEGCECSSCTNIKIGRQQTKDSLLDVTLEELEGGECQTEDIDDIMDWVFGGHEVDSDNSDDDDTHA